MKLSEIADRICEYLRKFEADKKINVPKNGAIHPYYHAYASRAGKYVAVCYVTFQGVSNLTKSDAEEYLRWLEAGNVGKHWKALSFNERVGANLASAATSESAKPNE